MPASRNIPVNTALCLIDGWPLDCTLSSDHAFESEVSDYKTENGPDITDDVRPKPITVTMDVIISDDPLPPISLVRGPSSSGDLKPSQEVYKRLMKIRNARLPVTIKTHLDTFINMALKNLTISRGPGEGAMLKFTAAWQQLELVENVIAPRVATPRAKPPGGGNKPADPDGGKLYLIDDAGHWYDDRIAGWRQGAVYNKTSVTQVPGTWTASVVEAHWDLYPGRPLIIEYNEWRLMTSSPWNDRHFKELNLARPTTEQEVEIRVVSRDLSYIPANQVRIQPYPSLP